MMFTKMPLLGLAVALLALAGVSACGPTGNQVGNDTPKGDKSTISGDAAATSMERLH
jgi:hypothetical protein